jgi:hypothetical protein
MAKLKKIIAANNFELVRDRIGEVLMVELSNQNILDPAFQVPAVFIERFIPLDQTEVPAINVQLSNGAYEDITRKKDDGIYIYYIDVYTVGNSGSTDTEEVAEGDEAAMIALRKTNDGRGDTRSARLLHRLMGMIRTILRNPEYSTLGFDRPSVEYTTVRKFWITDKTEAPEALSATVGRIHFEVKVPEYVELKTGIPVAGAGTIARLYDTDKGYQYSIVAGDALFEDEDSEEVDINYFIEE